MKKVFKIIFIIFIVLVILCGIASTLIISEGYEMYKYAISQISIEDKVTQIKSDEDYMTLDNVPKLYKDAVVAVEDHRFEKHKGIDLIATSRAVLTNITSFKIAEGGSTITQQLGKNLYFTQEQKLSRKVAELFVAFDLEREYSKDEILELYINTIYFGDGYNGIKEAAKGYLNKDPIDMTDYESVLLAGIPNAPSVYSLTENPKLAKERQAQVLHALFIRGYISKEESNKIINNQ